MASISIKFAADTLSGSNCHASGTVLGDGTPGAQAVLMAKAVKQFCTARHIDRDTMLALLTCTLREADSKEVG